MGALLTCGQLVAALINPSGTLSLRPGQVCPPFIYKALPKIQVMIIATSSILVGWRFLGSNLRVVDATLRSKVGDSPGPDGYGAYVSGTNIRFERVTVTASRKGIVGDGARNLIVTDARFVRNFEDGMILNRVAGFRVLRSRFTDTIGKPSECALPRGTVLNISQRACVSQSGIWKDGYHADAVQMRNATTDVLLEGNYVQGATQGLTHMPGATDAPIERVVIRNNILRTTQYHPITLYQCKECLISGNDVRRGLGSAIKAVILIGTARACGNTVPDMRSDDVALRPC